MAGNFVNAINEKIYDFVSRPENNRLQRGTGAYSTPFRGKLFGLEDADSVERQLASRRVNILWLGSNPNWSPSITKIMGNSSESDFPHFILQKNSSLFASALWDGAGRSSPDWDPIWSPTWRIYRDVFSSIGDIDAVTTANFLPWGSSSIDDFIKPLGTLDRALLARAFAFSNELIEDIIRVIQPKLVVVPFSLGRNPLVDRVFRVSVGLNQARNAMQSGIELGTRSPFSYWTGVGPSGLPVAYLPHPSSLRLPVEARDRLISQLAERLSKTGLF